MTTLDSSSPAESSMDDSSNPHLQTLTTATTTTSKKRFRGAGGGAVSRGYSNSGEGDAEVWSNFTESFRQVQSVLDRNRVLIQQVNENHQSKIHDNMVKNVALIQEINGNISKVVSLYSDLSTNFSSVFHQRNEAADENDSAGAGEGNNMGAWLELIEIISVISNP